MIDTLLRPFVSELFGTETHDKEARLAAFKGLAPGPLPADYEAFLRLFGRAVGLKVNHVEALEPPRPRETARFTYIGPNPPIDVLFGLQESHSNVIDELEAFRDRIPVGLISIGRDLSGNRICMDLADRGPNTVWHWFHEGDPGEDEHGHPGYGNMFKLAENFTDLCRRLRHGPRDAAADARPGGPSSR
jgi:hypothetical protein